MSRVLALLIFLLLTGAVAAPPAAADPKILRNTDLVGIESPGQVVRGITGVGAAWVTSRGSKAKVESNGDVKVEIHGLVLASNGTTGTVTNVFASVVCANGAIASTAPVPLSSSGDARIRATVDLPANCDDPIVLVRNANVNARWLAEAGL